MNVLMTGAGGFLGSAILERLLAAGHQVVACARDRNNLPTHLDMTFRSLDLGRMLEPEDWTPLLQGIDAVINCAGILREHRRGDFERVHFHAPLALARACVEADVSPFVQISALGDPADGEFVASKHRLDEKLLAMDLPTWLLRPSVVISLRGSYGGTSAMRAAAGLPGMLVLPGTGMQPLQPVLLEDLAETVVRAVEAPQGHDRPLAVVGPDVITMHELLTQLRAWLKVSPARLIIRIPERLVSASAAISDRLHIHPLGRTTWRMLQRGNIAGTDAPDIMEQALGVRPQSIRETLSRSASFVQDRWHARLRILAPLAWLALVAIWLVSGITGLTATPQAYEPVLSAIGVPEAMQAATTAGTAILNLILGVLLLIRWQMRAVLWLMLISVAAYTLVLGIGMPALWLDLTGGLIKNAAIAVLIGLCLITRRER